MLKKYFLFVFLFASFINSADESLKNSDKCLDSSIKQNNQKIFKYVLDNGLTILVAPVKNASQVAVQIWYKVGSKDETFGERGMAHFIEHMVFKGTEKMLSDTDVDIIGNKLSAYVNAHTWYDFTYYEFSLPLSNWEKVLPIFSDWMQNCRFKQDHMNSEVKAVIQELKMSNDNYKRFLFLSLMSTIFDTHPYHYTTIGFKQDLWALKRKTLIDFYKKHYIAQNATIVLVGDLDPEEAKNNVEKYFGRIKRGKEVSSVPSYLNEDIASKSVTIYRDVEQSIGMLGFVIPGMSKKTFILSDILSALLTNGKSSRLYKKLVDELGLVSGISSNNIGAFDYDLFFITFNPLNENDFYKIKQIILQEIENIIKDGFSDIEIFRAIKSCRIEKQKDMENVQSLADKIGLAYISTGDENYIFENYEGKERELNDNLLNLLKNNFKQSLCNDGRICKISCEDKKYLEQLQNQVGKDDGSVLAELERECKPEAPKYAKKVVGEKIAKKEFLKPELYTLKNGIEVMLCKTDAVDTVECLLKLRADNSYNPDGFDGALDLVYKMMIEGTKSYPGLSLAKEIESYGMNVSLTPGAISCEMLSSDVEKGFDFIRSMICEADFLQSDFDRVKEKQKSFIDSFWDEPRNIVKESAKKLIYKDHPYGKSLLGTKESIEKIDRDFCFDLYKKFLSPSGARLTVVGNFNTETIKKEVADAFESWNGQEVEEIKFPELQNPQSEQIFIEKNRDQVVIAFSGLSVKRLDPEYDYLLIFDQILARSTDSFIYRLREQTGLFYAAGGSILQGSDQEPGMICIMVMVAKDRVQEAYDAFMKTITSSVDSVTDEEFYLAKENIISSFCKNYDTNAGRAYIFDFLRKFNLPFDYYEKRFDAIRNITKEQMIKSVKKLLKSENISCIKVGKSLEI